MKRIQTVAYPDAAERLLLALREAGLFIAGKVIPDGIKSQNVILYVKDEEAIAVIMILKRAAYTNGFHNGKITIHGIDIPAQLTT